MDQAWASVSISAQCLGDVYKRERVISTIVPYVQGLDFETVSFLSLYHRCLVQFTDFFHPSGFFQPTFLLLTPWKNRLSLSLFLLFCFCGSRFCVVLFL